MSAQAFDPDAPTRLDEMSAHEARAALSSCCGATEWVRRMLARRPFGSRGGVLTAAREEWAHMEREDILEAFTHHPRIGADLDSLRSRFAPSIEMAAREQAAVETASESTLWALRDANTTYEERYGHIFIVCATGKTAHEMLELCENRMQLPPDEEFLVAAEEQAKITELRLKRIR